MDGIDGRLESGDSASTPMRAAAEGLIDLQAGRRATDAATDEDRWEMANADVVEENRPSVRDFGTDYEPPGAMGMERSRAGERFGLASDEDFEDTAEYGRLYAGTDRDRDVVLGSGDRRGLDSDGGTGLRSRMRPEPSNGALGGGGLLRHPGPSGTGQAFEPPGDGSHVRRPGGASQSIRRQWILTSSQRLSAVQSGQTIV
jgi:hypothetical protein